MMPGTQQPSMALAVVDQPPNADLYDLSDYDSSDSENENDFLPPGPLDPAKCTLSGPGFIGGSAGSPTSFVITAKDARSKRVTDGGGYVTVQVRPIRNANAEVLEATVKDQGDGTYTVTYSVSIRGNYELHIQLNGSPIGGNPFPVYFSPPDKNATSPALASAAAAATTNAPSVTSAAIAAAGAVSAGLSGAVPQPVGADGQPLHPSLTTLGAQAHAAGVLFPSDDEVLQRTILIANINPLINTEQVKQLFGFCGQVKSCRMVGNNQFAFVEYASHGEAGAAMGLNGQQLGDRALKVENAKSARETTPQGAANPYTAMQLQQMQQLQMQQMASSSLAAQVAQLRALAKTNPSATTVPAMSANSASQKAAALAAAALLQKKFGSTSGPGNADALHTHQSNSPDRRGSDRRRDDSRRDRDRRHDSRERRPNSRDRRTDSSWDHRSSRSHASADRRREADRIRESRADSRERRDSSRHERSDRHRHSDDRHGRKERHRSTDRHTEDKHRSQDRHVSSSRAERSRDDSRQQDRDRHRSKDREHRSKNDRSRQESGRQGSDRRRSSREDQPAPESTSRPSEEDAAATETAQEQQAGQDLQLNGTSSKEDAHSSDQPAADKLRSPDKSESSRAKSSRRHSSLSLERSPRHKHSKRHKKEHSHKKSKRSRHEDDASVGAAPAVHVATDDVTTHEAATDDAQENVEDVVAAADDLEALRQAALQTTKAAVNTGTDTELAEAATSDALDSA